MLQGLYRTLVLADISNYFDSIQHSLLFEYLMPLGLPRESIGLLARVLLVLRPQSGFSPTPQLGLPVDEFDCSRQIAHVFLFEHDRRIIREVGEDHYARWMDDQNVGTKGFTAARRAVRHLTSSLAEQRLTLNSGKTKFLDPAGQSVHFHLAANDALDLIEGQLEAKSPQGKRAPVLALRAAWAQACGHAKEGNWDKILKRFYGLAAIAGTSFLMQRSYSDLVQYPTLAPRIFEYWVARRAYKGLIRLFERFVRQGECLYESVAVAFFETILGSDPPDDARRALRALAQRVLAGDWPPDLGDYPKQSAALCLYWVGDKRSARSFRRIVRNDGAALPEGVVRALLSAAACLAPGDLTGTLGDAVRVGKPSVASLATTISRLRGNKISGVPGARVINGRWSWALRRTVYDARMWLQLEILAFGRSAHIRTKLKREVQLLRRENLSRSEERCLRRLRDRLR
jgi:hypothetical protein